MIILTEIIQCENPECGKHCISVLGIQSKAQKSKPHYFCSVDCAVDYVRVNNVKKYDILTENKDLITKFLDILNNTE